REAAHGHNRREVNRFGRERREKRVPLFVYRGALFVGDFRPGKKQSSNRLEEFDSNQLHITSLLAAFHASLNRRHTSRYEAGRRDRRSRNGERNGFVDA